jgi:type IV pilus assembly protein PilW
MNAMQLNTGRQYSGIRHSGCGPCRSLQASNRGYTLVELLVALTVSIFLVAGALQVYVTNSQNYRSQDASIELMENGRTAIELLARSVRMAGYWKCVGWQSANLSNHLASTQRGLYGTNGASNAPDTVRVVHAVDDTEVDVDAAVELTFLDTDPPIPTVTPNPITVSDGSGFGANDLIVINDCAKGDVLQISGVNSNVLSHNCTACVESYSTNAKLLQVQDTQYFIADNDRSEPTLYRIVNGATAEALLEGVEDMQIFYGEDTDSDGVANRYVTAEVIDAPCASGANPACWTRVNSVRISLLLRSLEDNVTLSPQTYSYNGATVTATDGRLRRAFTTIISLRNFRT